MANRHYTRRELMALIQIEAEFGKITYQNPTLIERLFFERTGIRRASGPLYMAMWRIKRGEYDELLYSSAIRTPEFSFTEGDTVSVSKEGINGY
ncbi:MAG: hypothetical protein CVV47_07080 [Spirochaetae bacterium HGW-Spirochaetae-3]|nr:MAG: hypothetical protein CVV47_07080 [Spirochaetae bacterium HGW-Spirochaetae-3]